MGKPRTITDAELANLLAYAHAYIDQHTPIYDGAKGKDRRKIKDRLFDAYLQITPNG